MYLPSLLNCSDSRCLLWNPLSAMMHFHHADGCCLLHALITGYWPKAGQPQGTYAQYVAFDEGHLAALPAAIALDTAGGLPLVGLTAWQVRRGHAFRRAFQQADASGLPRLCAQLWTHGFGVCKAALWRVLTMSACVH
jgi:hypothetical protein